MSTTIFDDPDAPELDTDAIDENSLDAQPDGSTLEPQEGKFMWVFTIDRIENADSKLANARVLGTDYLGRKVDWTMPNDIYQALKDAGGAEGVQVEYDEQQRRFAQI